MNNAKTANKVIKTALMAATLLMTTTLPYSNALAAEGLSYERIECFFYDTPIELAVMMPATFTQEQREVESARVCNSIKLTRMNRATLLTTDAVCDTDMNCEYWDRYHKNGIEKIFVAYDDDVTRTLVVMCKDIFELQFTDDPSELKTICEEAKK
jgi:hypothetical protein